jgi:hypothetical protein
MLVRLLAERSNGTLKKVMPVFDESTGTIGLKTRTVKNVQYLSREFPAGEADWVLPPAREAFRFPARMGAAFAAALELVAAKWENVRLVNLDTGETVRVNGNDLRKHKPTLARIAERRQVVVAQYDREVAAEKARKRLAA